MNILFLILPITGMILSLMVGTIGMTYVQLLLSLSVLLLAIYVLYAGSYGTFAYSLLLVDPLNLLLLVTVSILEFFIALYAFWYVRKEINQGISKKKFRSYYFWKNAFIFSMMLSVLSNNIGLYWVGLEATTLTTAFLISFYRNKESYEAAWKYVIMCSIGITIGLFSIVVLYFSSSSIYGYSLKALSFSDLLNMASFLQKETLFLSFILALVGFGTKVGFVPMHSWLPDAHSQAPSPISALLSGVLLNTALLGVLRFYQLGVKAGITNVRYFLLLFGLITLVSAGFLMLRQREYKRLFAYSSMENMGLITAGLAAGGYGVMGAALHILFHALSKGVLFMLAGNLLLYFHTRRTDQINGLFFRARKTAFLLIFATASIVGLPPFATFISKFYILLGLFNASLAGGLISLFGIGLAVAAFLNQSLTMLLSKDEDLKPIEEERGLFLVPLMILFLLMMFSFGMPYAFSHLVGRLMHEV